MGMIELDVEQLSEGTYEVRVRCVVSVRRTGKHGHLHFAVVDRSMAHGLTPEEAAAKAAASEMDAEIYRRNKR